jgi:Xaa-Pro aminopeptidase
MAKATSDNNSYPSIVDKRLMQLKYAMEEHKVEAVIITYMPNVRYLTNFSGSSGSLLIHGDNLFFITDDRYEEQIKDELYPLPNLKTHITRDIWDEESQKVILKGIKNVGFEADRMPYSEAVEIRNRIRPVKFKPAPYVCEPFTMPKSVEELEYIKEACRIAEETYEKMLDFIKPGITEDELAMEISYQARKLGSEKDPFKVIVTSGKRGKYIHGMPSDKEIKKNELVMMNFGAQVHGFGSAISRTVALGKATKEQQKVYSKIMEAIQVAAENVRPGMNGKHLDMLAREVIDKAGYGDNFKHGLGYGIGLVEQENPIITFRKDDQIVPEDVVLAIVPGVYNDKFGMRVEENIKVTKSGGEFLTNAPKEIPII